MDRTLRTSGGTRFKTFRLSDVPENVRALAAEKLADAEIKSALKNGKMPADAVLAATEILTVARDPVEAARVYPWACSNEHRLVSLSAWEQMMRKAGRW